MERVKKYLYRAGIITLGIVGIAGYIATAVIYRRIEDLETQLQHQEQRIQQFDPEQRIQQLEKLQVQVNRLEQQVNAATQSLVQYEEQQMNGNGSHYKPSTENHLGERVKK
mgnify:CR=1 FL=1